MTPEEIATIRSLMRYEGSRTAPPPGFPAMPDLPGGRYIDPRFAALESDHLWRKVWLIAGHMDEIPQPGCFKLWDIAGSPIVIVHARSGAVNAFYNTCSHRGAPVVTEASGRKPAFACKYHGWTYDDEGALVSIRDPEDFADLDFSCRGLKRVRCERFGNVLFVNLDPDAVPLMAWLGQPGRELQEFCFDQTRLVDHYVWDLDCNWKIAMEANMEVYHVPNIHPATVAKSLDHRRNVNTLYPEGHGRMVAPGWEGSRSGYKDAPEEEARLEWASVGELSRTSTQSYNLFPNIVSPPGATGFFMLAFWPNGLTTSKMEVWWFGPDWGEGPRPAYWDQTIAYLNMVLEEDTQFGKWIQKSQMSGGFAGTPLSYQEARIYHWHQALDRVIGPELIPAELQVAPVLTADWMWPNDPRVELAAREAMAAAAE